MVRRLQLERALRNAIALRQLPVMFQPQLDLDEGPGGRLRGAGVRWRHPDLPPPPGLAGRIHRGGRGDAGLINEIGEWVLRSPARIAAQWSRPLSVAVNLSAVQVMTQDLPALVEPGAAPVGPAGGAVGGRDHRIGAAQRDRGDAGQLHGLNRLGVRIALDGFWHRLYCRWSSAPLPLRQAEDRYASSRR